MNKAVELMGLVKLAEGRKTLKRVKKLPWKKLKKRIAKMSKVRFCKKPTMLPKVAVSNFMGKIKNKAKKLFSKLFGNRNLTESFKDKAQALSTFLEIPIDDIKEGRDNTFEVGKKEYLVLTDSEADEVVYGYIENIIWAFNKEFIMYHIDIDSVNSYYGFDRSYYDEDKDEDVYIDDENEIFYLGMGITLEDHIGELASRYEDGNDDLYSLIDNMTLFVKNAIGASGRGHFLSGYDGVEEEQSGYYIYRTS